MHRTLAIAVAFAGIGAPLALLATSGEAAAKSRTISYCLEDDHVEFADTTGTFAMKARLAVSGSHYVLNVWNVMPDNPQVLIVDANGTYLPNGLTRFRFVDNFDNHGRGSFKVAGSIMRIEIERVRTAPGGENIGRNYGPYVLSRRGCKWEEPQ